MAALIGESGIHYWTGFGMDAWFGCRTFEHGPEEAVCLRMCNCAGGFALFASDTAFWMYKYGFHIDGLLID
jgi:hypothetical protein